MKKVLILLCLAIGLSANAQVSQADYSRCVNTEIWKSIGVGGAYGATISFLASGVAVLTAPAVIQGAGGFIAASTIGGFFTGAGASATSKIYEASKHNTTSAEIYCAKIVAHMKANELKSRVGELKDNFSGSL